MNIQLIMMLPQPILVSYEPDVRDIFPYHVAEKLTTGEWTIWQVDNLNDIDERNQKKIIAGIPELPSVDFSALSEEDCKKIGWVDVEELAAEYAVNDFDDYAYCGFLEGFKTAQSLNEKRFNEEDVIHILDSINSEQLNEVKMRNEYGAEKGKAFKYLINKLLPQPRVFDVQVEMDRIPADQAPGGWDVFPKITGGSIKVLRLL